jgi:glyoxylase-like metal-dependent hydrolase (beta-lactamase superfamily II)
MIGDVTVIYGPRQEIFSKGSLGEEMYVVVEGVVEVYDGPDDNLTLVRTMYPGEMFGEMALIDAQPRSAATAAGPDGAKLLRIDHALFVFLTSQQPVFALTLMRTLSRRLRNEPAAPPPVAPPSRPRELKKTVVALGDNIFRISVNNGGCHSYLVKGSRKNALIDAGMTSGFPLLAEALGELDLSPADIHLLILTHEHADHVAAAPLFPTSTSVAAHRLAANKLHLQDESVVYGKMMGDRVAPVHVDIQVDHGAEFDLGHRSLRVLHTPGHVSGCVCLHEPQTDALFSGDMVFGGGVLGGIFGSGNLSDYIASLSLLKRLHVNFLFPGHGAMSQDPRGDLDTALKRSIRLHEETTFLFDAIDTDNQFQQLRRSAVAYSHRG